MLRSEDKMDDMNRRKMFKVGVVSTIPMWVTVLVITPLILSRPSEGSVEQMYFEDLHRYKVVCSLCFVSMILSAIFQSVIMAYIYRKRGQQNRPNNRIDNNESPA